MKINLPINQNEILLEPGKPIVTKTDLKGAITYANDPFVQVSGFSREELLGHNHNVVRHPDMPPEAFADLWRTIKAGYPWRGLVKNRAKDGSFYWVDAYVTPITEKGKTIGYQSVRSLPSRTDVQAAEALYSAIRAKQATFPATRLDPARISLVQAIWLFSAVLVGLPLLLPFLSGWGVWMMAVGLSVVAAAFAGWLLSAVTLPVRNASEMIELMSEGDFSFAFDTRGQFRLGHLTLKLHSMRVSLRAIFADVLGNSRRIGTEAALIEAQLKQTTAAVQDQSNRVDSISAALEQLSCTSREISHQAESAYQLAEAAKEDVNQGREQMRITRQRMDEVQAVVASLREGLERLNGSVQKVADISATINEIADQTNLLALNAAIEAARAGEQGRGFAVVADEVRKLAERTTACTSDIGTTLTAMEQEAEATLSVMEKATNGVVASDSQIVQCEDSLLRIVDASETSRQASAEILTMIKEQTAVTEDVANNLDGVRIGIEQTCQNAEQASAAVGNLNSLAEGQYELVRYLEKGLG